MVSTRTGEKKAPPAPPVGGAVASADARAIRVIQRAKKQATAIPSNSSKQIPNTAPASSTIAASKEHSQDSVKVDSNSHAKAKVHGDVDANLQKPTAKVQKNNKMVLSRVPEGPDTYVIACPEPNCEICRCFFTITITDRNIVAKKGQKLIDTSEILLAMSSNEKRKMVDLLWDRVPAIFRTLSAYTKMKQHLKIDHNYGNDNSKYPPLFHSPTLEQQERRAEKARQLKNKNNPSAIDH